MPADFLLRNTSTGALMILSGDTPLDAAALVDAGTYKVRALSAEAEADLVVPEAVTPGDNPDHVLAIWGQSEISNLYSSGYEQETGEAVLTDNAVTFWWTNRGAGTPAEEVRSHVMTKADGFNSRFVRMANALIRQRPGETFAIVFHTRPGGNFNELVNDSNGGWVWDYDAALEDALAATYDRTADMVLIDWQGSPSTYGGDYAKALHEILFGETFDGTSIGTLPATVIAGNQNEFTADHLLTEFYDWSQVELCVLEPHRFESNSFLFAGVRNAIRRMRTESIYADRFRTANAVLSYRNGKPEGGVVGDTSHPSPGEGSRRYGEGLMQAVMQARGLRPMPHVEIDNSYWEPAGDYVEAWSSMGPLRTIAGEPAGMSLNGTLYDAERTNFNRARVTAATVGRQLTSSDVLEFLPDSVGQTAAILGGDLATLNEWRRMPLVRTAPGGAAIPDADRAGAITAASNGALESAIESATGGEVIIVPAGTNIGNLRLNGANPASEVVIWSDGICAARMSQIYATNCSNLTFRNFHIERAHDAGGNIVILSDYADIKLIGNVLHSDKHPMKTADYSTSGPGVMNGISASGGTNNGITLEGNYLGGFYISLFVQTNGTTRIVGNIFEDAYEDHIKIANPEDPAAVTEIRGNFLRGVIARDDHFLEGHPDFIQFLGRQTASADWSNITISDNVIIGDSVSQGIFLDDIDENNGFNYKFVATIEGNLIALPERNSVVGCGIKMQMAGDGTIIRNNTCVTLNPTGGETEGPGLFIGNFGSAGTILVENNIFDKMALLGDATYSQSGNVILGAGGTTVPYNDVFGATIPNPDTASFNDAMVRFAGRGAYDGIGADRRNAVSILLDGIPVANDPDESVLTNTLSASTPSGDFYEIAGDVRIQRGTDHPSTTAPYTTSTQLRIDSTGGYKRLWFDAGLVVNIEVSAATQQLRLTSPYGQEETTTGIFPVGTAVADFFIAVNPATGAIQIYVDGVQRISKTGTSWTWNTANEVRAYGTGVAGGGITGGIERWRLWDEYSAGGVIPSGAPAADLNGGTFLADAADPRWLVVVDGTSLT